MLLNLKPQAYAWPIIVYSKQDISQLRDECNTFVEKLFDNSGHNISSIFLKPGPKTRANVTQKQYAALRNPKMYPQTEIWISTSHNKKILSGFDLIRTEARGQGHRDSKTVGGTPRLVYV